jgi:aspartate/methionine/tyrosine aminotransferase
MAKRLALPDFALEVYFEKWEFVAPHHLTASDAETFTVEELLALGDQSDRDELLSLPLSYVPTRGSDELRAAIASTYENVEPDDVLAFAGAGEALFWAMQLLCEPGEHAIVTVPNYQSIESVPIAAGIEVDGLPLWSGAGRELRWELDLDLLEALLRPTTRLVSVNFPNNPTGFVPDLSTWARLVELCDERDIRLLSDEVYRGVEVDPARTLPQAADLSPRALSVNVMSKAYGLPGLRVGWIATRDRGVLSRLERAKHYTSISNAGPGELLATLALRHADEILDRNRAIVAANVEVVRSFMADHDELFEFDPPDGGCVTFPRYLGDDGVETFCTRAVEEAGVFLVPASIYHSELGPVPNDRFRIGLGRRGVPEALGQLRVHLVAH